MTTNTSPWVVVDDADPAISYDVGDWGKVEDSIPGVSLDNAISQTGHVLSSNGSFSFAFTGTQIEVFGVSSKLNITDQTLSPTWTCSIDNINIPANLTAVRGIPWATYCSQFGLDDRSHVLTVNITGSTQRQFWLDYLRYTSLQASTQNQTLLYNSTDPALQYSGGPLWKTVGTAMVTQTDPSPTSTTPSVPPSLTFKFNGTGITWYSLTIQSLKTLDSGNPGAFPATDGLAVFTLDGTTQNVTISKAKAGDSAFDQILKKYGSLDPTVEHTLTATYQVPPVGQRAPPLSLDFLLVETGSSTDTISSSNPSTQPTATPGSPNAGSTTSTNQALGAKSSSVDTGAIVGGVLGGILFIILVLLLLRYWGLRQRSARRAKPHPSKTIAFIPDSFSDHHHETDSYPMRSPDSHTFEPIVVPAPTRGIGSKFTEDKSIEMESEPEPTPPRHNVSASNVDTSRQTMYSTNSVRQSTLIDFSEQQPMFSSQTPSINTVTNPFRRMNMAASPSPDIASLSSSTRSPSNPFRGGPLNPSAYR